MEGILNALNIKSEDDIRVLLDYFFKSDKKKKRRRKKRRGKEEEGDQDEEENEDQLLRRLSSLLITPEQVVQSVQAFLDDRNVRRGESAGGGVGSGGGGGGGKKSSRRAKKGGSNKVLEEKWEAWRRMAEVVSDEKVEGLSQLEIEMGKVAHMLDDRKVMISQVQSAQERNERLRESLNRYLSAPVNDDLVIPPTQTIQL